MSTLHKFKAYFGMVPLEDYEDDYLDEPGPARRPARVRESYDVDYADPAPRSGYAPARRDDYDDVPAAYEPARRGPRLEPLSARGPAPISRGATRGALAIDTQMEARVEPRRTPLFDDGGPLSKITTLRPRDYGEARTIGERFRDGTPVIMDLVEMSNADAKRLVDFAAGLAFALRGSFDKVATKVFLLSPADIDVSAEERKRIAETGFYNQS
ncbi:cell division protein SepF [Antrihabitans spumae]|uniref:Cell division protein SepF n=1 Tax=Antrihabitans spumae TaxID=3373370 RepID=A0ABW7KGV4_9NOCA